jgi:large subunit ribosomal protein L31
MKEGIHPEYYPEAKVVCACGNTWTTGSTKPEIHTDVCSECHPFFTGEQRIVDSEGHVERFIRRLERSRELQAAREADTSAETDQTEDEDS